MSAALIAAISAVLVALLGGGGAAALLNGRNAKRLGRAQAEVTEVSVVEVVQRIARTELERVEERIAEVERRARAAEERAEVAEREAEHQRRVNRAAIAYIERLLDYVGGRGGRETPPLPVELVDYLGGAR